GWHDAGDYGKYVVNSGMTTGELLWTYEVFAGRVGSVRLDIPESGGSVPDLLSEVRWNLDWMLKMQDRDGGVWHKLTSERFGGFVMPERDDGGPRYVIGTGSGPYKSSCATGDFAAVMAAAARIFRPFDADFAAVSLAAAQPATDEAVRGQLRADTLAAADAIVARTAANPYHVSLRSTDYVWGSNGVAANYGVLLALAYAMQPKPAYLDAAADNLHYLLGRNTFGLSW